MRTIRIGMAGLGVVGAETVRLLQKARGEFSRRLGAEPVIAAVCDRHAERKARALGLPKDARRIRHWQDLAADPSLDILVETMGGLEPARAFVLEALRSGKHVVTANKRLLAHHWDELFRESRRCGRIVRFEASVAGGIPLLQAIDQSLAADHVERVFGILNGTTNFILSRMAHEGVSLDRALRESQRLGLAERDPSMDLDGTDAAHKVAVIAALLTGRGLKPGAVARAGIRNIEPEDIRFAVAELERTIRLLGVVDIDWSARPARLTAFVSPMLIPLEHPLAGVHGEYNAVMVQASAAGDLLFYGKGAGPGPAASAVAGDVFQLCEAVLAGSTVVHASPVRPTTLLPVSETLASFYLRLTVADRPGVLSRITGILGRHGISIEQIHQDRLVAGKAGKDSSHEAGGDAASRAGARVFLTTHPARQGEMARAVRDILALSFVSRSHAWLRML